MSSDRLDRLFEGFQAFIDHKRDTRRPGRIAVFLAAPTLAGFIHQNIVAAALLRRFPGAEAIAFYRDDGGARRFVTDCNPCFHGEMAAEAGAPMTVPLDWFDVGVAAPVTCPDNAWTERGMGRPDLLLTPKTLSTDAARLPDIQDAPPALRLRDALLDRQEALLAAAGLPPTRWHACVDPRSLGPASEVASLIRHIADGLGGRIILVGDPALEAPAGSQTVDLRRHPAGIAAQALAIASSRFVLGGGDWPVALASALRVPVAVCGVADHRTFAWNRGDWVLLADPASDLPAVAPAEAAEALFRRTADVAGRRTPAGEVPVEPAERLTLPLPLREATLLEFRVLKRP